MLDIAIRGGTVVDGTGRPARRADVGVSGDRVLEVGEVGPAETTIDATGRVVAPGFVDIHSHFDAQLFWDSALTPSPLHGVTTTISGNCGFTLAPLSDAESADYLVRMLAVVEGMPLESLQAGVPCDWRSTADYLDRAQHSLAINAGFLVGHSAMRRTVMGEEAVGGTPSPEQQRAMERLLADGLKAGGLGFSSSWGVAHFDGNGDPVPSVFADGDELAGLAGVCADYPGTSLEFLPPRVDHFDDRQFNTMVEMSRAAQRPINWNVLRISADNRSELEHLIEVGERALGLEARIVALNMPIPSRAQFSFKSGFVIEALPGWEAVMSLPVDARCSALADPEMRRRLAGSEIEPAPLREIAQWDNRIICETFTEAAHPYLGRSTADIAEEEGKTPLDALLDIAISDGLETKFRRPTTEPSRADWQAMVDAWRTGHVVIGASDAGAHLDFTAYFDYPVYIIEKAVRDHGVLSLEEAVHFLTQVPATLYGLRDRGCLAVGGFADIVVFDPDTVACGTLETRFDLPAGAGRLYAEPRGVADVLVNGAVVVSGGSLTSSRPGTLLRSGRDTATQS